MSSAPRNTPVSTSPGPWLNGAVPVIGLIGGIGSGKSLVAALLADRGAVVIDADEVGHRVLEQPEVRRLVLDRFGIGVLSRAVADEPDGPPIDRRKLGAIVFSDPQALRDLETLLHPRMKVQIRHRIEQFSESATVPAIVLDAAILLETGWSDACDLVVFVDAPQEARLARVRSGRGWTLETLQAREAAQWPLDEKRARADLVIENQAGIDALERSVERLLASLGRSQVRDLGRAFDPSPAASGRRQPTRATAMNDLQ